MTSKPVELGSPWYQNFWPWFIVILLGVSVAGSLLTVAIAYQHKDVDVRVNAPIAASNPGDRVSRDSRDDGH